MLTDADKAKLETVMGDWVLSISAFWVIANMPE